MHTHNIKETYLIEDFECVHSLMSGEGWSTIVFNKHNVIYFFSTFKYIKRVFDQIKRWVKYLDGNNEKFLLRWEMGEKLGEILVGNKFSHFSPTLFPDKLYNAHCEVIYDIQYILYYPILDYPNLDYPNLDYPTLDYPNRVQVQGTNTRLSEQWK